VAPVAVFQKPQAQFPPLPARKLRFPLRETQVISTIPSQNRIQEEEDNHDKRSSYVLRLNQRSLNIVFQIGAAQEL